MSGDRCRGVPVTVQYGYQAGAATASCTGAPGWEGVNLGQFQGEHWSATYGPIEDWRP